MELTNKYDFYLKNLLQDENGFIESHECDSLLFTGLVGCDPNVHVNIDAAFDGKLWHRRPLTYPKCFDCDNISAMKSGSSISRDMLLGLAWYCYYNKRLDIVEQVIGHAMKNWGIMGCAKDLKTKWGRCQIMPALFATYCWISYRLGGPKRWWAMWVPADMGYKNTGFQAHLQVLHILLRKDISGKITDKQKKILQWQYERSPANPLFAYAVGKKSEAQQSLMNQNWWPEMRLPTTADRKTQWLMQRDPGKDWSPDLSRSLRHHSGGDLVFMFWLLFRRHESL